MNYPKDLALAVIHILGGTSDDKYFIKGVLKKELLQAVLLKLFMLTTLCCIS